MFVACAGVYQEGDSAGEKFSGSIINGLIFVVVIFVTTFVLFLLFKYGVGGTSIYFMSCLPLIEACWNVARERALSNSDIRNFALFVEGAFRLLFSQLFTHS